MHLKDSPKIAPSLSGDLEIYQQTLNYLYSQMPAYHRVGHLAYKPGLDNSLRLDAIFNHPHRCYKTIHIAGTNGKGSTSHLLAAILQQSGYKVGLYTSPHLVDFRERVRVNGEPVSKKFVVNFVEKYKNEFETVMPSFFELTMEMAFLYFAEQKVDVAVIETGLGGRLDSTNIISPDLCVITNIGFDHTEYLGDTLPKIAAEKAGIIKPDTPVVIGEAEDEEVNRVFIEKSVSENAPIVFAETQWNKNHKEYPHLRNALKGLAQQKNTKTVLAAVAELKKIGYQIPEEAVYEGFENVVKLTGLMGRWHVLHKNPKIVCDTGHNAHGIKYIAAQLKSEKYEKLHVIFGMVNDKDISSALAMLPQNAVYYFTKASVDRALNEKTLAKQAAAFGLHGDTFENVYLAIKAAKENADENDFIFIGGSNFIVADALLLFPCS